MEQINEISSIVNALKEIRQIKKNFHKQIQYVANEEFKSLNLNITMEPLKALNKNSIFDSDGSLNINENGDPKLELHRIFFLGESKPKKVKTSIDVSTGLTQAMYFRIIEVINKELDDREAWLSKEMKELISKEAEHV